MGPDPDPVDPKLTIRIRILTIIKDSAKFQKKISMFYTILWFTTYSFWQYVFSKAHKNVQAGSGCVSNFLLPRSGSGSGNQDWGSRSKRNIYGSTKLRSQYLAFLFCYDAMQPLFCCIYLPKNYSVHIRVNTSKLRNISDYALHNRAHAGGVSLFNISILEQKLNTCALITYCMFRNLYLKVLRNKLI